ncbi:MAG: DUF2867 domain-containing protein [Actinobacteria bacterium]|nr:DUF2867 domain-containing protein [Actinomycetota bacterium]
MLVIWLPDNAPLDPAAWAKEIFRVASAPRLVKGLLAMSQAVVRAFGVRRAARDVFSVHQVQGEEALIIARDRHLDFAVGVGVDAGRRLLRITTVVQLHGWRGRLYFLPVRILHDPITRSMANAAVARLST